MRSTNNNFIVLKLLRENKGKPISGEYISKLIGISRASIWKHVNSLREKGYIIEGAPRTGYCLVSSPDLLHSEEIKNGLVTKLLGKRLLCLETVNSTNKEAGKLAEDGADEGTVIIAEEQVTGRGRRGRHWHSPAGLGLWMSLILRPKVKTPEEVAPITAVAALVTAKALHEVTMLPVMIKWPNDLFINGRKVGGLLAELKGEPELVHYIIMGIGININHETKDFPSNITSIATSLKKEGGQIYNRREICQAVLKNLDLSYDKFLKANFSIFRKDWLELSITPGKTVTINCSGNKTIGKAVDIDANGALILEDKDGKLQRFSYGEIE